MFAGFATGMTYEQAVRHAETLAARVRELHVHHPHSRVARFLTVSIGVAEARAADGSPDGLLRRADAALYAAKHAGKRRFAAYHRL